MWLYCRVLFLERIISFLLYTVEGMCCLCLCLCLMFGIYCRSHLYLARDSARQQLENKRGRITQLLTVNIVSETNKHIQFCATCMGSDIYHLICIQV